MEYSRKARKPQKGMNSNRRSGSLSYPGLVEPRTNRLGALPGPSLNFDTPVIGAETYLLINESRKTVTVI
jgi:hypothetical protein